MVESYRVPLLNKKRAAEGAVVYEFAKPKGFRYAAGQFVNLTLNGQGNGDAHQTRSFSLASAPYEKRLTIAAWEGTSRFKHSLQHLTQGSEVLIRGPFGKFVLHEDASKRAVFLAGGIGITPVRSIILQATRDRPKHRLAVFYSSRTPETTPFLAELRTVPHPNYTFIATMTRRQNSKQPWKGEHERINSSLLEKYLPKPTNQVIYYLVGSNSFVNSMVEMLTKMGLDRQAMKLEKFGGR